MLRTTLVLVVLTSTLGVAVADGSCKAKVADKKLSGAAMTSFMNKCSRDAGDACDEAATGKKLFGAARTSFNKKCLADAVGA